MNKFALVTIFFSILLFKDISLNAQNIKIKFPPGYNVIVQGERIPGVTGSQYLSEKWTKGRITLNDGNYIDSIDLRLNAYKNEMHYLDKGIEYSISTPKNIKEIIISNRKFIYSPYIEGSTILYSYFEVLAEGKTDLLALHYIIRKPSSYNQALDYGEKNDRLVLSEKYFIRRGNTVIEHDKKGKNLMELAGIKGDQIKTKIKEDNLSLKKKEDLIKLVTYANTLN